MDNNYGYPIISQITIIYTIYLQRFFILLEDFNEFDKLDFDDTERYKTNENNFPKQSVKYCLV